jgi:hypothetical protein
LGVREVMDDRGVEVSRVGQALAFTVRMLQDERAFVEAGFHCFCYLDDWDFRLLGPVPADDSPIVLPVCVDLVGTAAVLRCTHVVAIRVGFVAELRHHLHREGRGRLA